MLFKKIFFKLVCLEYPFFSVKFRIIFPWLLEEFHDIFLWLIDKFHSCIQQQIDGIRIPSTGETEKFVAVFYNQYINLEIFLRNQCQILQSFPANDRQIFCKILRYFARNRKYKRAKRSRKSRQVRKIFKKGLQEFKIVKKGHRAHKSFKKSRWALQSVKLA